MKNSIDDILITCDFCGRQKRFGEIDQVCLRPLTEKEVEKFKEDCRVPLVLEFAMQCSECKEEGKPQTLGGYSIDTEPVEIISMKKVIEISMDKEFNRMRNERFKKGRR